MNATIPKKCRRMVNEYAKAGYALVRSDRHNLLKLKRNSAHNPIIYIHANPDSPYCGVSMLNRRKA
jgi:hypothetical protein